MMYLIPDWSNRHLKGLYQQLQVKNVNIHAIKLIKHIFAVIFAIELLSFESSYCKTSVFIRINN